MTGISKLLIGAFLKIIIASLKQYREFHTESYYEITRNPVPGATPWFSAYMYPDFRVEILV